MNRNTHVHKIARLVFSVGTGMYTRVPNGKTKQHTHLPYLTYNSDTVLRAFLLLSRGKLSYTTCLLLLELQLILHGCWSRVGFDGVRWPGRVGWRWMALDGVGLR